MGIERLNELEQEFRVVKLQAAYPLDLVDYVQLKQRLAAIVEEARKIIRAIEAPEPEWCRN